MKAFAFHLLVVGAVLALLSPAVLHAQCDVTCTATVPPTGTAGSPVSFASTATPCACSGSPSYYWTFGDGADSTEASPTHTYSSNGAYSWQLTVTSESATCTKSGTIGIGSVTPPAGTYSGTTSAGRPFSVTVNGSAQITGWTIGFSGLCGMTGTMSVTTTCSIVNGSFTCGSASCIPYSTQSSISGSFIYSSGYRVGGLATLKGMPATSSCCTQTPTFSAGGTPALVASASADVTSGNAPLTVNFTGSASGGTSPYSYSWNFGDCTAKDTAQNPSHTYAAGDRTAVLTVTDSGSVTADSIVAITALTPGITVSPTSDLVTSESGGTAQFSVVLDTQPGADVTIEIDTAEPAEGRLSTDGVTQMNSVTLTFTPGNWSTPQWVTVHGQDDLVTDGNVVYTIVTAASTSLDAAYAGIDPSDVSAKNDDNDVPGVTVTPIAVLTEEVGINATFDVVLQVQPINTVIIDLASSDTTEATVSPSQLTFTPAKWSIAQTVTVYGVNDTICDGNQTATIALTTNPATGDPAYAAFNPDDVTVTNVDDDPLVVLSTDPSKNSSSVARTANLNATTNGPIDSTTVGATTFRVQGELTGTFTGAYSVSGFDFAMNPAGTFKPGEKIKATATSGIQSLSAAGLAPHVWHFAAATTAAAGLLFPYPTVFDPYHTWAVALGDVDADGDVDVMTADDGLPVVRVWVNDGTGVFSPHPIKPIVADPSGAAYHFAIALGDLDGDGDLDAVMANYSGAAETVFMNGGGGNFSAHPTIPTFGAGDSSAVSLADLDGDGDLDAVVGNDNGGAETTWLNGGSGDFTPHPTTPSFGAGNTMGLALGDVDGDGDIDAVVPNFLDAQRVWLNDGAGNLSFHASFGSGKSTSLALGDLDGDGDLDAVVGRYDGQSTVFWKNDGTGSFSYQHEFGGGDTQDLALGDMNGDGFLDLITVDWGASPADTIWRNVGGTAFVQHATFAGGFGTDRVRLADLDGDGDLDAVVTNAMTAGQTVWNNRPDVGVTITPATLLTVAESGTTATFTVVLDTAPRANVSLGVSTSDPSEGLISDDGVTPGSSVTLTFTPTNWNTPQTITVHGRDDYIDDGDVGFSIMTAATTSSDPDYAGVDGADAPVTNTDDDTAAVDLSTGAVTVAEAGTTATFTVVLHTEPVAAVVIDVASLDTTEASVSPAKLTFGVGNWTTPQIVTVTGVNDYIDDGDVLSTIALAMNTTETTDTVYLGINPADVAATTTDDDTAAVTVSAAAVTVAENGSTATFTVVLQTEPVGAVVIDVTSLDTTEASVSPAKLTFGVGNWTTPQIVTVTGVDDYIDDGDVGSTIGLAMNATETTDTVYLGINPADVAATTIDDDTAAVLLSASSVIVAENGSTATFTVVLQTEPVGAVVIDVSSLDTTEASVSPAKLTFGVGNWTTPQIVTVTGVNDFIDDGDVGSTIALAMNATETTDTVYVGINPADVAATTVDDDTAAVTLSTTAVSVSESGTSATFTVVLATEPVGNVVIDVASTDLGESTVSPAKLTFTSANWSTAQTVTVTGVNDYIDDGDVPSTIGLAMNTTETTDTVYLGINPADIAATTTDDDTAAVTLSTTAVSVSESGTSATFTVVLATEPVGNVVIDVASTDLGESTVSPAKLTFTSANWSTAQTVTVTGVNDFIDDGDVGSTIGLAMNIAETTDAVYAALDPTDVTATTLDDDRAGVLLSAAAVTVAESGTTATFTVVLQTEPVGTVVIDVSALDTGEATAAPAKLTFTSANWSTAQTVTVTGVDDFIDDGDVGSTIALAMNTTETTDAVYLGINPADVAATTTDDDTAAITVSTTAVSVSESGTSATFTVVLATEPTGNVVTDVASTDLGEATVSPAKLTFTSANWSTAQTVTVTGVDDFIDDGDVGSAIALAMNTTETTDTVYLAINPADVAATTVDDDTAVVTLSTTAVSVSESGTSATFTVVLATEPTGNVVIDIASTDLGEATVSPAKLTFTSADWSTAQTVTVTGVDDFIDDGDVGSTIGLAMNTTETTDTVYFGINPADVAATTVDDDTAAVTVSTTAVSVSESGTSATFTVVLATEPAGNVVIDIASTDLGEASVSPAQLTFTTANWSTPQTVTVTGVDDSIDDGDQVSTVTVTMNPGATADPNYDPIDPADVTVTTADNDKGPTITTLSSSLNPSNTGQSVTFSASVSSTTPGTITGTVTFRDGATTLATVALAGGSASHATDALPVGSHSVTAAYSGDASYDASTSAALDQVVNAPFGAPPSFSATAAGSTSVSLSWGGVAGALSYEIYRTGSIGAAYALVGSTAATSYTDTGRTANTSYLYKVRAIGSGGASPFSAVDVATTTVFTDAVLDNTIRIKAVHVTELRTAVNAMRSAAGLIAATFTDPVLGGTIRMKAAHVTELRTALSAARSALGLPPVSFTDGTLTPGTTKIKAVHLTQLRGGVQ